MVVVMTICPGIRAGQRCRYRLVTADTFGLCWHCWLALPSTTQTRLRAGGADARLQLEAALRTRTPLEEIEVT